MKKPVIFLMFICLLVLVSGCVTNNQQSNLKYNITIVIGSDIMELKLVRPSFYRDKIGCVLANDPLAESRGWFAKAIITDENGIELTNPDVAFETNKPQCVSITKVLDQNDVIRVNSFSGSIMGKSIIKATYLGETTDLIVYAYGLTNLTLSKFNQESKGFSFENNSIAIDNSNADFYIKPSQFPNNPPNIIAPYGIKLLGYMTPFTFGAFFEPYQQQGEDNFVTEIFGNGIFEIISSSNVHYKLALVSHSFTSGENDWSSNTEFAWDYFTQPEPTPTE